MTPKGVEQVAELAAGTTVAAVTSTMTPKGVEQGMDRQRKPKRRCDLDDDAERR